MSEINFISKLGSSASKIKVVGNIFQKVHFLKNEDEYLAVKEGIRILHENMPKSIKCPSKIIYKKDIKESERYKLYYEQERLSPWIEAYWITGQQLFNLGLTILNQQKVLFQKNLCLVDARPSNYWLGENVGKLVDLAGIKPISKQNLLSFETDFRQYFILPLILEKELNIPTGLYFKGNLNSCNLNLWGTIGTYKNFNILKEAVSSSFINFISNKISSSSPSFIEYLNKHEKEESIPTLEKSKIQKVLNKQLNLLNKIKPKKINRTNWDSYETFHDEGYTLKKLESINNFVNTSKKEYKIVDLGSNLTTKDIKDINLRVDNDISVCRHMRQLFKEDEIVLQLNIAECLSSDNYLDKNILNLFGDAKASIMTSIIHHLIIDYGLSIDTFYLNISKLYDKILLEFPCGDDPMVKLLIRKKNEHIVWDWDKSHKPICLKYFDIKKKLDLSKTRFMIYLENKNNFKND